MRKRFLPTIMALIMVLSLMPTMSFASEGGSGTEDDPYVINQENVSSATTILKQGGYIRLDANIQFTVNAEVNYRVDLGNNDIPTYLNLNGYTISLDNTGSGHLYVTPVGEVTIYDGSESQRGKISSTSYTLVISANVEVTLESGTIETSSGTELCVQNAGTFNMLGGNVRAMESGGTGVYNYVADINNPPTTFNMSGGKIEAAGYGVALIGAGIPGKGENTNGSAIRNDLLIADISGNAEISGSQGIGTNASAGEYAGFTIDISENAKITGTASGEDYGCGMYLPAIGITNISGGTITGAQGIRIAAGDLNITGGSVIGTEALSDNADLISGGSGGTQGAIVAGKAGSGYVGDLTIDISGNATISNRADGDVVPAIVVSDKNMSDTSMGYDNYSITVNVNGATVAGDVIKVSNRTDESEPTNDGGDTSLTLSNAKVTGDVINQSKNGDLSITGGSVGSVTNDSAGSVTVSGSSVAGNVENKSTGDVVIQKNAIVTGSVTNTGTDSDKGSIAILNSRVGSADTEDSSITIVNSMVGTTEITGNDYEARVGATLYPTLSGALDAVKDSGGTITLLKDAPLTNADYDIEGDVTITGGGTITVDVKDSISNPQDSSKTIYYHAFTITPNASLTLDGVAMDISGQGYGIDIQYDSTLTLDDADLNIHNVSNATISSKPTGTTNPGTINVLNDSTITATGINGNFSNGGVWTIEDSTVTIQDCTSHGFSASAIIVDNATVNISNTGRRGISINDVGGKLEVVNGGSVSVSNTCTSELNGDYAVSMNSNATGGIQVAEGSTLRVSGDIKLNTTATNNLAGVTVTDGSITGGKAMVDGKAYATLADALEAVSTAADKTVTLLQDVTVSDKIVIDDANVTLDGDGHSITVSTNAAFVGTNGDTPPVNSVLEITANNVTIQDVELIGTEGKTKHGVQFYNVEGGKLSDVTVTDTAWTGVLVNASEVTIENSVLNPTGNGVYATIEYAMGDGTLTRIPELHLNNVSSDSGITVWADNDTVTRVINASNSDGITDATTAANAIRSSITTENNVAITVSIEVIDGNTPEDTTVPSTKPSTGGGSTRYTVTVEDAAHGTVTSSHSRASRGTRVTLTVEPDEGYILDELVVTDADGDEITLTKASSTRYTFTMPRGAVTVEASFVEGEEPDHECPSANYDDLSVSAWYHNAVDYVLSSGMMSGVSAYEFAPEDTLSRAMLVQILWAMEGKPQVNYLMQYEDVAEGTWYAEAVRWASSEGVVSGYSEVEFGPERPLTRQELMTILYAYAKQQGLGFTGTWMFQLDYADAESVADWAYEASCWCTMNGVVSGKSGSLLDPQGTATRAEAAQMLMNFSLLLEEA